MFMRALSGLIFVALLMATPATAAPSAPERVDIARPSGVLHALLYKPDGNGPFPAVIALHGCAGLTGHDEQLLPAYRDWTAQLLKAGNAVLFPDSYGSRDAGAQCHAKERRVFARRERVADVLTSRHWLLRQPWVSHEHIGLMGWDNGASALLWAVRPQLTHKLSPDFRSAVAFYPDCRVSSRLGWSARVPTLLLIGARDETSSPAACREMIDDARGRSALARIVIYPGADHDFDHDNEPMQALAAAPGATVPASARASRAGDLEARTDAQKRVADWLTR